MSDVARIQAQIAALQEELVTESERPNFSPEKFGKIEKKINQLAEQKSAMDRAREVLAQKAQPSRNNGEWSYGEMLQAVMRAGTKGAIDSRLSKAGIAESDPASGGFAIQPELAAWIYERMYQEGQWLKRCDHTPIATNTNALKITAVQDSSRVVGSQYGGVYAVWLQENGTITESEPKYRQVSFDLKKLAAFWGVTDEMLADAAVLTSKAPEYFERAMRFQLEDSIVRGTGAGQPLGFLNSPALVTATADKGQATKTITFNNILNMLTHTWGALSDYCWFANADTYAQILSMSQQMGTAGQSMFWAGGGVNAPGATLAGIPLVFTEQSSTLGSVGDFVLCNMKEFMVVDKSSPQMMASPHVYFQQDKMAYRLVGRFDGQPMWEQPLTPAQGSSLKSPFIALAAR
jgi:HK97 family phage major capsid protein